MQKLSFIGYEAFGAKVKVDYGTGDNAEITSSAGSSKIYNNVGEYIVKVENVKDFTIFDSEAFTNKQFEVEILQWGKIRENNEENRVSFYNVKKIYEPEPDKIPIEYYLAEFTEIPEWLFDKKVRSTVMSTFENCTGLTSIPEGLFKNNVNAISFERTFENCIGLKSIPEGLFKNNVNATSFVNTFGGCIGLKSIPEKLFKYNTNTNNFSWTFRGCSMLTNIPNEIIEAAKELKTRGGDVLGMFMNCTLASNYNSLPDYMK